MFAFAFAFAFVFVFVSLGLTSTKEFFAKLAKTNEMCVLRDKEGQR